MGIRESSTGSAANGADLCQAPEPECHSSVGNPAEAFQKNTCQPSASCRDCMVEDQDGPCRHLQTIFDPDELSQISGDPRCKLARREAFGMPGIDLRTSTMAGVFASVLLASGYMHLQDLGFWMKFQGLDLEVFHKVMLSDCVLLSCHHPTICCVCRLAGMPCRYRRVLPLRRRDAAGQPQQVSGSA